MSVSALDVFVAFGVGRCLALGAYLVAGSSADADSGDDGVCPALDGRQLLEVSVDLVAELPGERLGVEDNLGLVSDSLRYSIAAEGAVKSPVPF